MSRCDQAGRLFGPYWDDEVTQAEREWLESHLGGCTGCRQRYEGFARTLESVGSLPRTEVASDLPERSLVAARRAMTVPDRIAVLSATPRWVPVTAAAVVLLVGVGTLLPLLGSNRGSGMLASRDTPVALPRLVANANPGAAGRAPSASGPHATLADSLFDHAEDVEFVLDPVLLRRGRAQSASQLPQGVQGEQTVISF